MHVVLSHHALQQIAVRNLSEEKVIAVAAEPEQIVFPADDLPPVAQSQIVVDGKMYLLRVVFRDIEHDEDITRLVITAYRTSQIEKYWQDAD